LQELQESVEHLKQRHKRFTTSSLHKNTKAMEVFNRSVENPQLLGMVAAADSDHQMW
jgi:hypothetical protein